ncbi:MAG: hypothetical protein IPN53_08345 [Comamonadaceae bacterium]|nr:hypothetical protein [Comamonadaceae bacterium]
MEFLGKIRRMQVRDKLSERAIAKRTGLSRNTVHKWLQTPEEVQAPKYVRAKGFNKLGDFTDELEQSLKADALRPKKGQTHSTRPVCANPGQYGYAGLLNCVSSHGLEAVLVAVELVIESGALSTEHVLNVLARLNAAPVPESVQSSLPLGELPVANTGRYDSLRHGNTADVNHEAASLLELNHAS